MPSAPRGRRAATGLFLAALMALACAPAFGQMLDRRWARHIPDLSSYAVSPDGSAVVASNIDGLVQSLAGDGAVRWRARFPAAVRCAVSAKGALTVAWSPASPRNRSIVFLDDGGRTTHTETAPGPVKAVVVSDDGDTVLAWSEPASLTILRRSGKGWRWRRRRLAGNVTSIAMDPSGGRIVVGRGDPAGVSLLDRELQTVWHWVGREDTVYRVRMGRRAGTLMALGQTGPGRVATAFVWDAGSATPRWSRPLRGDLPVLTLSPDERYVAAAYRARIWHGRKSAVEWRVTLYSATGRSLWEVGGLIFGAHLIGATGPPHLVLTHDDGRVLAALDTGGHMRARHRLAAPVRSTASSADGSHFAVLTDARVLYLFRARR